LAVKRHNLERKRSQGPLQISGEKNKRMTKRAEGVKDRGLLSEKGGGGQFDGKEPQLEERGCPVLYGKIRTHSRKRGAATKKIIKEEGVRVAFKPCKPVLQKRGRAFPESSKRVQYSRKDMTAR